MSAFLGVPVDAAYHVVSAFAGMLTPLLGGLAAAAAIVAVHHGRPAAAAAAQLPGHARAGRAGPDRAPGAGAAEAARRSPGPAAARADRPVPVRGHQHVRRLPAAAAAVAVPQRHVPAVPVARRSAGRRTRCSATTCSARRWAVTGSAAPGRSAPRARCSPGLFVLLAGIGWLSVRVARRFTPADESLRAGSPVPVRSAHRSGPKPPGQPDGLPAGPAAATADAVAWLAPFITVAVAAFVPLAAGLYLVTSAAWTLAERTLLPRAGHHP